MKQFHAILFMFFSLAVNSQEFHVDIAGDNGNDGSAAAPWKSIQYAMEIASPGDTVLIHRGNYDEPLYLEVSGEEDAYITFRNFGDDVVIIDGGDFSSTSMLEISNKHHVSIEGLSFRNFEKNDAIGILIEGESDHIRIKNCKISGIHFSSDPNAEINDNTNSQPLIVYGTQADHAITDLEIIGNEIFDCRTGYSEALAVNGNVDGFTIQGNLVHDITNIGIDVIGHEGTCSDPTKDQARNGIISENTTYNCLSPYATSAGIYVDGGKDLIIERNLVYDNQWGIEIGCENIGKSASNIVVRNNFIYGNNTAGIAVGGYEYPSGSGKVSNVQIVNNTLYNNDQEDDGTGEFYLSYNEGLRIVNNNISATNTSSVMLSTEDESAPSINVEISYNNWYDNNIEGFGFFYYNAVDYNNLMEIDNTVMDFSSNISRVPQFVGIGDEPDLHLKSSSVLLGAGKEGDGLNYGSIDIDGEARIEDEGIDIGADEYSSGSVATNDLQVNSSLAVYPNPTCDYINVNAELLDVNVDRVDVTNVVGQMMSSHSETKNINLGNLANGVYLLKVYSQEKLVLVLKVMKK